MKTLFALLLLATVSSLTVFADNSISKKAPAASEFIKAYVAPAPKAAVLLSAPSASATPNLDISKADFVRPFSSEKLQVSKCCQFDPAGIKLANSKTPAIISPVSGPTCSGADTIFGCIISILIGIA